MPHPYSSKYKWPGKGRLKWIGGNISLDFPIMETVLDDCGNVLEMSLEQLLQRLDDFEGYRGNVPIKDNLLSNCFSAYEYRLMTDDERQLFEQFVRDEISKLGHLEAARRLIIS